jgi:hypothetical protein
MMFICKSLWIRAKGLQLKDVISGCKSQYHYITKKQKKHPPYVIATSSAHWVKCWVNNQFYPLGKVLGEQPVLPTG